MQEMLVRSLGREDPLKKEMSPTSVFLPGKFHGQRSLVGCNPWGHKRIRHDLATKQQVLWMKAVKFLEHLYNSEISKGAIESIYPFSLQQAQIEQVTVLISQH